MLLTNFWLNLNWYNLNFIENIIFIFFVVFLLGILFENNSNSKTIKFLHLIVFFLIFSNIFFYDMNVIIKEFAIRNFENYVVWPTIAINPLTNLYFFISSFLVSVIFLSFYDEFFIKENNRIEYSFLIFLIYIASLALIVSMDLIEILVALECIALASYILVSFERNNKWSSLGGIQYLIISTIPATLFILGIILLYSNFGTFIKNNLELILNSFIVVKNYVYEYSYLNSNLSLWTQILTNNDIIVNEIPVFSNNVFQEYIVKQNYLLLLQESNFDTLFISSNYVYLSVELALFFMIANFLFKVTAAPFHIWAPSIYNNAPLASTLFLATFSKVVMFSFFINLFLSTFYNLKAFWGLILLFASILSIAFGMFGAFNEKFIKKFVVFSSMSHVGFMLVGFPFFLFEGNKFIVNYLIIYTISSLIIWFIFLTSKQNVKFLTNLKLILGGDALLNFIFSINMFSMSGIPPLAGFFVKFDILYFLLNSSNFYLSFFILLATVANFFYYLRMIKIIYFENISVIDYFSKTQSLFNKNNTSKYLLISIMIHLILFYVLYYERSFFYIMDHILKILI